MKSRPQGFLSNKNVPHNSEVFDYVAELHSYLWRFVRVARPGASGDLGDMLDDVIDSLEAAEHSVQADTAPRCPKCGTPCRLDSDVNVWYCPKGGACR